MLIIQAWGPKFNPCHPCENSQEGWLMRVIPVLAGGERRLIYRLSDWSYLKTYDGDTREMVLCWLRAFPAIAEDLRFRFQHPHRVSTTTCLSSYRASESFLWFPPPPVCTHISHTNRHKKKIFQMNKRDGVRYPILTSGLYTRALKHTRVHMWIHPLPHTQTS